MKYPLFFFLMLTLINAYGQLENEKPYTYNHSVFAVENTITFDAQPLDIEALYAEDKLSTSDFERAGVVDDVSIDMTSDGSWFDLPNGDKLWMIKLRVPNAIAVSTYFSAFKLPVGSKLYAYSPNYEEILETYTFADNPESGLYATDFVRGEVMVLEYYEPKGIASSAEITISGINGFYQMIPDAVDPRGGSSDRSGSCQVDVACSEGDNWRQQIDGVVRITVLNGGDTGFCSGSLVNNTAEDCTPYVLSAHHCAIDDNDQNSSAAELNQWLFRFKFENNTCGSPVALGSYSQVGCSKVARSTNNSGIDGSDFILLELNEMLDEDKIPYFNGWDASGMGSESGVAIHHPGGDKKKISTYASNLISSNWSGTPSGSHWRVFWIGTENGHGVSEGGSSGSPIFNADGLIVGQLSGGSSECSDEVPNGQTFPDLYGKMSYNWSGSGNVESLSTYLDPIGGGTTKIMHGNYYLCSQGIGTVNSITEYSELEGVKLFPNPAKEQFMIDLKTVERVDVIIYNQVGQQVVRFNEYQVNTPINISYLSKGLYSVKVGANGIFKTEKLVVQ